MIIYLCMHLFIYLFIDALSRVTLFQTDNPDMWEDGPVPGVGGVGGGGNLIIDGFLRCGDEIVRGVRKEAGR